MHRAAVRAASSAAAAASSSTSSRPALAQLLSAARVSPGIGELVVSRLGDEAKASKIQELAINHFFPHADPSAVRKSSRRAKPVEARSAVNDGPSWLKADADGPTETLIAAETGSGKTYAFLLPLLHKLKTTESAHDAAASAQEDDEGGPQSTLIRPRAVILAPTHELARQLAAEAKSLCHIDKLKVLCLSSGGWLDKLKQGTRLLSSAVASSSSGIHEEEEQAHADSHHFIQPDIIVCTPSSLLRTLADNRQIEALVESHTDASSRDRFKSGRKNSPDHRTKKIHRSNEDRKQLVSLADVRAIVIDEADVLLAPDFGPSVRSVLHLARKEQARATKTDDIPADQVVDSSKATLDAITAPSAAFQQSASTSEAAADGSDGKLSLPFDLVLATATIPTALQSFLRDNHPKMTVLASDRLHRLPSRLKVDFADPAGNKMSAVAREVRKVLSGPGGQESKILVFMNRATSVDVMSRYLTDSGIPNVAVTSSTGTRSNKSNAHISLFLREKKLVKDNRKENQSERSEDDAKLEEEAMVNDNAKSEGAETRPTGSEPRVLITTSLLSRGLDFDPSISHVFLPDRIAYSTSGFGSRRLAVTEAGASTVAAIDQLGSASPSSSSGINELELLHRAGRAARAGNAGRVIIFDKRAAAAADAASLARRTGTGKVAMVRNKEGMYVPKPAEPLRKAVRSLLVRRHRPDGDQASSRSTSDWNKSAFRLSKSDLKNGRLIATGSSKGATASAKVEYRVTKKNGKVSVLTRRVGVAGSASKAGRVTRSAPSSKLSLRAQASSWRA